MGKVISVLFFGMFAAAGTFSFVQLSWSQISQSIAARSWQSVSARLISHDLKVKHGDSGTYKVVAEYQYEYWGKRYTSNKVSFTKGSDNLGSYHHDMNRRLARVSGARGGLTVWVNPKAPSEAVIDRDLRWASVLLGAFFLLVFGGLGYGGIYLTFKTSNDGEPLATADPSRPWTRYQEWNSPTLISNTKLGNRAMLGFAIFWNLISLGGVFAALQAINKGNYAGLLALLFPAIGVGLIWWWYKLHRAYQLTGPMPITLDPYPASLGGHFGGVIRFQKPIAALNDVRITVCCLRSYISGSGEGRETKEKILWDNNMVPAQSFGANGLEYAFCFDLAEDLPVSEPPLQSPRKTWRISFSATAADGTKIERDYDDVPVFATSKRSTIRDRNAHADSSIATVKANEQLVETVLDLHQSDRGQRIVYPPYRHKSGLVGLIIGITFIVFGFAIPSMIFNIVFPLMGGLAAFGGAYSFFNSLEVRLSAEGITSQRSFMGYCFKEKFIHSSKVKRFTKEVSYTSSTGKKNTEVFNILAYSDTGKKVTVAEDLKGLQAADAAIKKLQSIVGISEVAPERASRRAYNSTKLSLTYAPLSNIKEKKSGRDTWDSLIKSKRIGLHWGRTKSSDTVDYKLVSPFKRSTMVLSIVIVVAAILVPLEVHALLDTILAWANVDSAFGLASALFQTLWLAGWSVGVLVVLAIFVVLAFGNQTLLVDDGKLDFIIGIPLLGFRITIKASEISDVYLVEPDPSSLFVGEGMQIQIETTMGEDNSPFGSNHTQSDVELLKQAIELNRVIEVDLDSTDDLNSVKNS